MRSGRGSIARLMIMVALVGLELGMLRILLTGGGFEHFLAMMAWYWPLGLVGVFLSRGRLRRFFVGFSISCPVALVVYVLATSLLPNAVEAFFMGLIDTLNLAEPGEESPLWKLYVMLCLSLPQLLLALIGGLLAMTIRRKPRTPQPASDALDPSPVSIPSHVS